MFFRVDDTVQLQYEIVGTGQPVLLIHGFMGTGATEFPDLRDWLAQAYQVITPDLRGYGQSLPKPRRFDADFYRRDAADLAALLDHLNLDRVLVMGYSDGGEVALWLPLLAPQRIAGVVTWGATGHFDASIKPALLGYLSMGWHTPQVDALHGAEHIAPMTQSWVHAMLGIVDAGGDVTYSRAAEIACPVLMMLGDADSLNPVERGQAMADALPKGELVVFAKTGHGIHAERPRPFQKQVEKFLKRHS